VLLEPSAWAARATSAWKLFDKRSDFGDRI
jgi:hypothetical protein